MKNHLFKAATEFIEERFPEVQGSATAIFTICVIRENENIGYKILAPYGVFQERLFYWGSEVKAAVYDKEQIYAFKTLKELQPYHWWEGYEEQAGIQGTKNK